ncbi:hypothetical protein CPAR01_05850 [Colletotrichum paranaense]|uniref:Uncharacterized protein n=1 Tax=Colletotrichum paranaense TaxID=1914294 RepID=A0ABQ9SSF8_9PEZI|nr:uncharacterized protein CPAR01_05850 [Colletotrichum paranaense]KAK1542463.1 hypothetical protein CPAR01_05850 [Colletotrichum paranaense]
MASGIPPSTSFARERDRDAVIILASVARFLPWKAKSFEPHPLAVQSRRSCLNGRVQIDTTNSTMVTGPANTAFLASKESKTLGTACSPTISDWRRAASTPTFTQATPANRPLHSVYLLASSLAEKTFIITT